MGRVKVTDDTAQFMALSDQKFDVALGMMAQDIEMIAAFKVPVDTGSLSRFIRKYRINGKRWKVSVNKEYAAYQERGARADGSRRVVNYSRPGSGAHFLEDSAYIVTLRSLTYIKKALGSGITDPKSRTDFG